MRDVLPELVGWWREGRTVGLATVIATWRSAPRQPGAAMLLVSGLLAPLTERVASQKPHTIASTSAAATGTGQRGGAGCPR